MNFEEDAEAFENAGNTGQSKGAILVQRVYARTTNFLTALKEMTVEDQLDGGGNENSKSQDALKKYLDFSYIFGTNGKINGAKNPLSISFNNNSYESINSRELPDLRTESSRSIVVIEFFTHCCINCIHSIEDIRQVYAEIVKVRTNAKELENGFKCDLKIVSVHSPKFTREKDRESINAFTQRMKMDYSDVVNDPDCILWNELGICCWPTVLILGPSPIGFEPNLLFTLMGEGHKECLKLILTSALEYFDKKFQFDYTESRKQRIVTRENFVDNQLSECTFLKYPGKVTYYQSLLAISDSGNNRIVVSTIDGQIKHIIGGPTHGLCDGDFETARFYNPQGIAFENEHLLYVADTGNHSIRKVDLKSKVVTTLVFSSWNSELAEETVILKSPWDLVFYSKEVLLVASAGNHRIFGYFFANTKLYNVEHAEQSFAVIAGSGKEENRNNSYILKASFAQPSGICVSSDGTVYIADSESSSIRSITSAGKVAGVVGGARDPTDLFAYGDADGKGFDVKLQHPMGVSCSKSSSDIYFADTYNHKIKVINTATKVCNTLVGDGITGDELGKFHGISGDTTDQTARLNEPSGICFNEERMEIYIADTNNHSIKIANIVQKTVQKVSFDNPKNQTVATSRLPKSTTSWDHTFDLIVNPLQTSLEFEVLVTKIPPKCEGGQWRVTNTTLGEKVSSGEMDKGNSDDEGKLRIKMPVSVDMKYILNLDIFLCGPSSCFKKTLSFRINFNDRGKDVDHKHLNINNMALKFEPSPGFFDQ